MSIIKQIDYIDGDRHYSEAEILEVKKYVVCKLREKDGDNVLYEEPSVWFALDNLPFELTQAEIDEIQNPVVSEAEVING